LDYVPSYNTFQDVPRVLDPRQIEITVSQLGKSTKSIIEAIPVSKRKTLVALLVSQFIQTSSIPSVSSPEVGLPVIRFLSLFDPTPKALEVMPIQKRTVNLGLVLETFNPPAYSRRPSLPTSTS
jgi:hypothetical protein